MDYPDLYIFDDAKYLKNPKRGHLDYTGECDDGLANLFSDESIDIYADEPANYASSQQNIKKENT